MVKLIFPKQHYFICFVKKRVSQVTLRSSSIQIALKSVDKNDLQKTNDEKGKLVSRLGELIVEIKNPGIWSSSTEVFCKSFAITDKVIK